MPSTHRTEVSSVVIFLSLLLTGCADGTGDGSPAAASTAAVTASSDSITGLDFPGSAAVQTTMRFKFDRPDLNGLPIYGPSNAGVTYIWRAYPRQQAGYYTAFFWGNDDGGGDLRTLFWKNGSMDSYYGPHPYPNNPPNGNTHKWEIAVQGDDYVNGAVVYDRWYTQALRVWADASGIKHHEFYWDLPNTDPSHMVTHDSPSYWGNATPPYAALNWGDAPWNVGAEVWSGVLRGIQIYATKLSLPEIQSEVANPLSTTLGATNVWYLNINPTPNDISDKSGKGHHPAWVGSERPGLYSQNADSPIAANDSYAAQAGTTLSIGSPGVLSNDTAVNGGQLSANLVSFPTYGTLTLNANGGFSYTPNAGFTGTDSFSYRASDGSVQSNTATVTLTVTGGNQAPVANNDTYATQTSTALSIGAPGVLANDNDPDSGTTLNATLVTTATHGTLTLNPNGGFSYAPNTGYTGSDTFTYRASDGMLNSNTATVTLTVTSGNQAPVAMNDAYTTPVSTRLTVEAPGVLANDSDPNSGATLTAAILSAPTRGTLTLNPSGGFSYTPNAGVSGTDSFTYRASDGMLNSNAATVTLTVGSTNSAFTVMPTTLAYYGTVNGPNQVAGISIKNNSNTSLTVTWSDNIGWLVATSGDVITIPPGGTGTIDHTASMATLWSGTWKGTAMLKGGNATQHLPVILTIR